MFIRYHQRPLGSAKSYFPQLRQLLRQLQRLSNLRAKIRPHANGMVAKILRGMERLFFTAQLRARVRITPQKNVRLLDAPMQSMRDHPSVLWIAWEKFGRQKPKLAKVNRFPVNPLRARCYSGKRCWQRRGGYSRSTSERARKGLGYAS